MNHTAESEPQFAELHVHLQGAIPLPYFRELLRRYPAREAINSAPERFQQMIKGSPNIEGFLENPASLPLETILEFDSLRDFFSAYIFSACFVRTKDDLEGLVSAVLNDLSSQGLAYVEITVSVIEYLMHGMDLDAVLSALSDAPTPEGLTVCWIVDLVRNIGPERTESLLDDILRCPQQPFSAITLGGSEDLYPPHLFVRLYEKAKDAELGRTVHAGEALGPESVRDAIELLGVDRIGHGVRAIEDPSTVALLAERKIPLEVCITGNILTGVAASLEQHPVRQLYEAGVPVTINTDDPTFFRTSLAKEYELLPGLGFSSAEINQIAANGFRYGFLPN